MQNLFSPLTFKSTRYGRFLLNFKDGVQRHIGGNKFWDDFLRPVYDQYLNKESIFIDVGAFIGSHTVYCALKVKAVYCFEPQPNIFYQLCANIMLNKLVNVFPFNMALWHQKTKFEVQQYDNDFVFNGKSTTQAALYVKEKQDGYVLGECLDNFNFPKVSFIKIDAQGSDYNVILGAKETIQRCRPIIAYEVETCTDSFNRHRANEYEKLLNQFGYNVSPIYKPSNFLALPKSI